MYIVIFISIIDEDIVHYSIIITIVFGRRKKPLKNSIDKSQEFVLRLFNHLSIFNSTKRGWFCVFRDRQTIEFFSQGDIVFTFLFAARASILDRNILAKMSTRAEAKVRAVKTIGSGQSRAQRLERMQEGSSDSRRWGFRWYFFEVSCAKIDITACQSDDSSERKHSSR